MKTLPDFVLVPSEISSQEIRENTSAIAQEAYDRQTSLRSKVLANIARARYFLPDSVHL